MTIRTRLWLRAGLTSLLAAAALGCPEEDTSPAAGAVNGGDAVSDAAPVGDVATSDAPAPADGVPSDTPGGMDTPEPTDGASDTGCAPACAGRECGDDGCGGTCGACPAGTECLDGGQCAYPGAPFGPSAATHAVDGAYTGFAPGTQGTEWLDIPARDGDSMAVRADFDGTALLLMLDSPDATGALDARRQWAVEVAGSAGLVRALVDGTGAVTALVNGIPCAGCATAAVGRGPSPLAAGGADHTLVELSLPGGVGPVALRAMRLDGTGGLTPVMAVPETVAFVGALVAGGGLTLDATAVLATITGVEPEAPAAGDVVRVSGAGFGTVPGQLWVGGAALDVLSWADGSVMARLPASAAGAGLALRTAAGQSERVEQVTLTTTPEDAVGRLLAVAGPPLGMGSARATLAWDGLHLRVGLDVPPAAGPVVLKGSTSDGDVTWRISVPADGPVEVRRNGRKCGCGAGATAKDGPSPWDSGVTHRLIDVTVEAGAGRTTWAVDGGDGAAPGVLSGWLLAGGGALIDPGAVPAVVALDPAAAGAGAAVVITGRGMGDEGAVRFANRSAEVTSWTPGKIGVRVPAAATTGPCRVTPKDADDLPSLWFVVPTKDADGDGAVDGADSCASVANADQADLDGDGVGDACDPDIDGDGRANGFDPAPTVAGAPGDEDQDGTADEQDNCPFVANPGQADLDQDNVGDACDADIDNDGVPNAEDAFPEDPAESVDSDKDGVGDNGDAFPNDPNESKDSDQDGVGDNADCKPQDGNVSAPDCTGKACGDDGCGGTCGACPGSQICTGAFACDFDYGAVPKSTYPHTVDGAFTDWTPTGTPAQYEWHDVQSAPGQYTHAYFDYDGTALYILNDWHLNDAGALGPNCYNLFGAYTGGGAEQWQVKVFADGRVEVWLNGQAVDLDTVEGAAGFGPSPLEPTPHTIFELKLPASPGGFGVQLHDPGPTSGCDVLVTEPSVFIGVADAAGGLGRVSNTATPWIIGLNPASASAGAVCAARGSAFGPTQGTATVGGVAATVVTWRPDRVVFVVPEGAAGPVVLTTAAGVSTNAFAGAMPPADGEPAAVINPKDPYPHTVDGAFTDWTAGSDGDHEWKATVPAMGKYTYAYFDYDGEALHILNDWHVNDAAALTPTCFNLFKAWTGGGSEQWTVRVYGSGTVTVELNGTPVDLDGAEGAVGFGPSPLVPVDHTIFELRLPASPGGFGVQLHDPGPTFACEELLTDPSNFQGSLDAVGGSAVTPSRRGTIWALVPPSGGTGSTLQIEGSNLGEATGEVWFGGVPADVVSWSDTQVTVVVPAVPSGPVWARPNGKGTTNSLWFDNTDLDGDGIPNDEDCAPEDPTNAGCSAIPCDGDVTAMAVQEGGVYQIAFQSVQTTWVLLLDQEKPSAAQNLFGDLHAKPVGVGLYLGTYQAGQLLNLVVRGFDGPVQVGTWSAGCSQHCLVTTPAAHTWTVSCELTGNADFNDLVYTIAPCQGTACAVDTDHDGVPDAEDCAPQNPQLTVAQCDGKICGDDGCGGSCGACAPGQVCLSGGAACDFDYGNVPKSQYPHTVDGAFTSWNPATPGMPYEWFDVTPAAGQYTHAYFDYDGTYLHILNDWHLNDGAVDPTCYNLFGAYTGGGTQQWQIKVFADGTVQAWKNGALVDTQAEGVLGAYGFGPSPMTATPHTIYELRLPAAPGGFGVQLHDPGPTSGCGTLVSEPAVFVGVAQQGGGLGRVANTLTPWLIGLNPATAGPGTLCAAAGAGLGDAPGTVTVGGQAAVVVSWRRDRVTFLVPGGVAAGPVVLTTAAGFASNAYPIQILGPDDEPAAVINAKDPYPHTVDGKFTDWPAAGGAAHEWQAITPATGMLTYAYFDYDGTALYILNDWHANDVAALQPQCFNRFRAFTGGGAEVWEVRVYGDGHTEVERNGEPVNLQDAVGAVGFGPSPNVPDDHTIFELKLPASPGGFGVQLHDPGPTFDCVNDMLTEPAAFQGTLDPQGGTAVTPSGRPTLWGIAPAKGPVGTTVVVDGTGLGATQGTASCGGVAATVQSWSDTAVTLVIADGAASGLCHVTPAGKGQTNGLWFEVTPPVTEGLPVTAGLLFWVRADTLALQNGAQIATWADESGSGLDLVQPDDIAWPIYTATGMGGKPGVSFDGAMQWMRTAQNFPLTGDPGFTVFTVIRLPDVLGGSPVAWIWGDANEPYAASGLITKGAAWSWVTGFNKDANTVPNSFQSLVAKPAIVSVTRSPGAVGQTTQIAYNGGPQPVTGDGFAPSILGGFFYLGAWSGAQAMNAVISEVVVYERTLSAQEHAQVSCALAARWGITPAVTCPGSGGTEVTDCTAAVEALDDLQTSVKACEAASTADYCATDWSGDYHQKPGTDTCGETCALLGMGCTAARAGDFSSCQGWGSAVYGCDVPKASITEQPDLFCLCDRNKPLPGGYVANCTIAAASVSVTDAQSCVMSLGSVETPTMCMLEFSNTFAADPSHDTCDELCALAGMTCITSRATDYSFCGTGVPNQGQDIACDQPVGSGGTLCHCFRGQPTP